MSENTEDLLFSLNNSPKPEDIIIYSHIKAANHHIREAGTKMRIFGLLPL